MPAISKAGVPARIRRALKPTMLQWVVLAGGLALTGLITLTTHDGATRENDHLFATTAANIHRVIAGNLDRRDELLTSVAAMIAADPDMANSEFARWEAAARLTDRYKDSDALIYLERVPVADVSAFAARRAADPVTNAPSTGPFALITEQVAPTHYCLQRLGVWRVGDVDGFVIPAGLDFCSPTINGQESMFVRVLDVATTTGQPAAVPVRDLGEGLSATVVPVYRDGTVPSTTDDRRSQLIGWVTSSFSTGDLVEPLVADAPGLRVEVTQTSPAGPEIVAAAGTVVGSDVHTSTVSTLGGNWTITVTQGTPLSLSPTRKAGAVAMVGTIITLLLFGLLRTLTRSRDRALALVRAKTEELEYRAMHDVLTGLPNRAVVLDRATMMLSRRRHDEEQAAALFIDLDNFKAVNDTLGHGAGDAYLRVVAARIQAVLRDGDTVGRLGGDEFVVLLDGTPFVAPELVAQRILDVMAEPIVVEGTATPVSCSIGIAVGHDGSAEALLHSADVAMYRAKTAGKGRFALFEPEMQEVAENRITLEWDLHHALERNELFLLYQPTFDLQSRKTIGIEALLRWRHPERGVVDPAELMRIAEESGLIVPIGRWALHQACVHAAGWADAGHDISVSVNVSGRQLDRPDFATDVRSALEASGLTPSALTLEITETTLMRDPRAAERILHDLKAVGVRIAIDDFGTGYSSMASLQKFPVDAIKIDRSFITAIASNDESRTLIRTLVQLGKALDLETLAEGIEDHDQLDELIRNECDAGQGFLYATPLDPDALQTFLRDHVDWKLTTPTSASE